MTALRLHLDVQRNTKSIRGSPLAHSVTRQKCSSAFKDRQSSFLLPQHRPRCTYQSACPSRDISPRQRSAFWFLSICIAAQEFRRQPLFQSCLSYSPTASQPHARRPVPRVQAKDTVSLPRFVPLRMRCRAMLPTCLVDRSMIDSSNSCGR